MLPRAYLIIVRADYPNHRQWQDGLRSSARSLRILRSIRIGSVLKTLQNDDIRTNSTLTDLTEGLFQMFAPLSTGVINVEWVIQ